MAGVQDRYSDTEACSISVFRLYKPFSIKLDKLGWCNTNPCSIRFDGFPLLA